MKNKWLITISSLLLGIGISLSFFVSDARAQYCAECLNDAHCPIPGEVCQLGVCTPPCSPSCTGKECGGDGCGGSCGSCPGDLSCSSGSCICTSDSDCSIYPTRPFCDGDGDCVECLGNGDCSGGGEICTSGGSCCIPETCGTNECKWDGCGGTCNNCASATPACKWISETCVECTENSHCPNDCVGNSRVTARDCNNNICDLTLDPCGSNEICNSGACECAGGFCNDGGGCVWEDPSKEENICVFVGASGWTINRVNVCGEHLAIIGTCTLAQGCTNGVCG